MSQPAVVTFSASNTTAIGALQNYVANTPLIINSTNISGVIQDPVYFKTQPRFVITNFQRKITLTSANNLSATSFTIVGSNINSQAITEVLAAPNANTVTSVNNYNIIYSITPNNNAGNGISVGTGATGISRWIKLDANRINPALAVIQAVVTGTITYTVNGTTSRVEDNFNGVPVTPAVFANPISVAFTGATTTLVNNEVLNYQAVNISITASTGGSLTLTVLQSGI